MNSAIIVAAGRGSRMRSSINKQYIKLLGKCILLRTLEKFFAIQTIQEVIVVIAREDKEIFREMVEEELRKTPRFLQGKKLSVAYGGKERADSVTNGLKKVDPRAGLVLIHDGVRPFVTEKEILCVMEMAQEHGAAILGVRAKDTLKRVENGVVTSTIPRHEMIHAQTPQCFYASRIKEVYAASTQLLAEGETTDDATLVERAGHLVHVVEGSYENIKITTPIDILLGEEILKMRKER